MYNVGFFYSAYLRTQQERTFIYSGLYDIVVRCFVSLKIDNNGNVSFLLHKQMKCANMWVTFCVRSFVLRYYC